MRGGEEEEVRGGGGGERLFEKHQLHATVHNKNRKTTINQITTTTAP